MRGEPHTGWAQDYYFIISTHSPRAGRTRGLFRLFDQHAHFNSLAPCGANLAETNRMTFTNEISTHSPRAGRTIIGGKPYLQESDFNSLAPCGANLAEKENVIRTKVISTHSPRAGRTSTSCIFVDRSPLLGADNNVFSRLDCHFLRCSSANLARFSNQSRFAIRT